MKYLKISDSGRILQDILHEHLLVMNLELPIIRHIHEHSHEFGNSNCSEGERFLPNSPTLVPRGSGLTLTIRFHENSRNSIKNVTLGTSEWTRVSLKTRNGHIKAVPRGYPFVPINRRGAVSIFYRSVAFFGSFIAFLLKKFFSENTRSSKVSFAF
jgi:hypothetical protein